MTTLLEAFTDDGGEQRIAVGGAANLTRYGDDFERNVKPVLEALEEHVILLKLLGEATDPQTLTVRIGHENPYEELATTSVVATGVRLRSRRRWPRSASSARPAWTIRARWAPSAPSRATSAKILADT